MGSSSTRQEGRTAVPTSEQHFPRAVYDRLVKNVQTHAKTITKIAARGKIVVVVFEPADEWRATLRETGWDGQLVFELGPNLKDRLARADPAMASWLGTPRPGTVRLFVAIRSGVLLLNPPYRGSKRTKATKKNRKPRAPARKEERDLEALKKGVEDDLNSLTPQLMDDPVLLAHMRETMRLCGAESGNSVYGLLEDPETWPLFERRAKEFMELVASRKH